MSIMYLLKHYNNNPLPPQTPFSTLYRPKANSLNSALRHFILLIGFVCSK